MVFRAGSEGENVVRNQACPFGRCKGDRGPVERDDRGEPCHVQFGCQVRGGGLGADRGAAGRFFRGGGGTGRGVRDLLAVPRRRGLRADDGAYTGAGGGRAWTRLGANADAGGSGCRPRARRACHRRGDHRGQSGECRVSRGDGVRACRISAGGGVEGGGLARSGADAAAAVTGGAAAFSADAGRAGLS